MNKCNRCKRELKNPRAKYGPVCAKIMGVDGQYYKENNNTQNEAFKQGVLIAQKNLAIPYIDDGEVDAAAYAYAMGSYMAALERGDMKEAEKELKNAQKILNGDKTMEFKSSIAYADPPTEPYIDPAPIIEEPPKNTKPMTDIYETQPTIGNEYEIYEDKHPLLKDKMILKNKGSDNEYYLKAIDYDGYIVNQSALYEVQFGAHMSDYNGCSWVAVYNALKALGKEQNYKNLTKNLQKGLIYKVGNGAIGIDPGVVEKYIRQQGYTTKQQSFTKNPELSDVNIIMYKTKMGATVHYVAFVDTGNVNETGENLYKFYNAGGETYSKTGEKDGVRVYSVASEKGSDIRTFREFYDDEVLGALSSVISIKPKK